MKADPIRKRRPSTRLRSGFTLIELLVAMSILAVLLLLLSQLLDQVQKTWNYSEGRVSQFREARVAFDIITKNLSQASLNTYWDYEYENNLVSNYKRQSELHFLTMDGSKLGGRVDGQVTGDAIFFQAPLGVSNIYRNLNNLFNARGYYLLFGPDTRFKPSIINSEPSYRFRIMEYRAPAEFNQIYIDGDEERRNDQDPDYSKWFRYELEEYSNPLAENVIAFVISPRDTMEESSDATRDTYSRIARDYNFDSNEHPDKRFIQQVPPLVRVTMVVLDEQAAVRLEAENGTNMPNLVPGSLFLDTGNFDQDVEQLEEILGQQSLSYRVFSTMVAIRSSKWSTYTPET